MDSKAATSSVDELDMAIDRISNSSISMRRTILVHLGLIHLQLQPGTIDDLVGEDGTQEDLGERASKGFIPGSLCQLVFIAIGRKKENDWKLTPSLNELEDALLGLGLWLLRRG